MKKMIALSLALIMGLVGCSEQAIETEVEASIPQGFRDVSYTEVLDYGKVLELENVETGCKWIYTEGYDDNPMMVQVFKESENGTSVPDCN